MFCSDKSNFQIVSILQAKPILEFHQFSKKKIEKEKKFPKLIADGPSHQKQKQVMKLPTWEPSKWVPSCRSMR